MADLEIDVVELTDEVDDVESINTLQEQRLNTIEIDLLDNDEDIEGLFQLLRNCKYFHKRINVWNKLITPQPP